MPYLVETAPEVRNYLERVEGLLDTGLQTVIDGYIEELGNDADRFLALYPLGPDSLHFRYEYPHPEGEFVHAFDFVVDGSHMEFGVVRVVYVEHTKYPVA